MTEEQIVEKLIGILQPIYQEGRLTEDEVMRYFIMLLLVTAW